MKHLIKPVTACLSLWAECMRYPKESTPDLIHIWASALAQVGATPDEVKALCHYAVLRMKEFPTPSEGLEMLCALRVSASQPITSRVVKALDADGYIVLTVPEKCLDGRYVEAGGNGVGYDVLVAARVARGLPARGESNAAEAILEEREDVRPKLSKLLERRG